MKKVILTMLVAGAALMAQTANTPAPAQNSAKPQTAQKAPAQKAAKHHRHAKKSNTAAATKNAAKPSTPSK